ncbi:PRC-barrel domain-containing protein [Undibacterium sp. JH2W]|uniref:PRC-barrel domain-containing protein n=1 Tax=Undibacterium sp. JH2W TaxID=3413037 RepID=UPI003BF153BA
MIDNTFDTYIPDPAYTAHKGPGPDLMGASTLIGDKVVNLAEEHLGDIKEIMLNTHSGNIAYAVVAHGGLLGIGEKLFAVPWSTLRLDALNKRFILDIAKIHFENSPGFDSENWPDMADQMWVDSVQNYYTKSK